MKRIQFQKSDCFDKTFHIFVNDANRATGNVSWKGSGWGFEWRNSLPANHAEILRAWEAFKRADFRNELTPEFI